MNSERFHVILNSKKAKKFWQPFVVLICILAIIQPILYLWLSYPCTMRPMFINPLASKLFGARIWSPIASVCFALLPDLLLVPSVPGLLLPELSLYTFPWYLMIDFVLILTLGLLQWLSIFCPQTLRFSPLLQPTHEHCSASSSRFNHTILKAGVPVALRRVMGK